MEEKYVEHENATIHYKIVGKGLTVVFIHGFAEDATAWTEQVAFLKDKYKLILPDIPGTGKSTLLQKESITMEDYAGCLKAILDAEKIDKIVMIGHSMGGYIMLAFAEKYPDSLLGFGLFHSSAYADDPEKVATRKKAIAFIKKNGVAAFLNSSIPGLFYDAKKGAADIENLLQKGNKFIPEALVQYYEAMITRPDRTIILKNTALPVLFILGEHDKAIPFKHGLEQAKLPMLTYLYILRNSAHMGMLEETSRSNDILGEFLQIHE
ncbi:MAG: alpha/beta hydrolase [Ferruginibacter sp.]|nr:alpha/beta hydrolase [Ferruginibacter sp.]